MANSTAAEYENASRLPDCGEKKLYWPVSSTGTPSGTSELHEKEDAYLLFEKAEFSRICFLLRVNDFSYLDVNGSMANTVHFPLSFRDFAACIDPNHIRHASRYGIKTTLVMNIVVSMYHSAYAEILIC
jgi:hypothetical protein